MPPNQGTCSVKLVVRSVWREHVSGFDAAGHKEAWCTVADLDWDSCKAQGRVSEDLNMGGIDGIALDQRPSAFFDHDADGQRVSSIRVARFEGPYQLHSKWPNEGTHKWEWDEDDCVSCTDPDGNPLGTTLTHRPLDLVVATYNAIDCNADYASPYYLSWFEDDPFPPSVNHDHYESRFDFGPYLNRCLRQRASGWVEESEPVLTVKEVGSVFPNGGGEFKTGYNVYCEFSDSAAPACGNGREDPGESCLNCAEDMPGHRCVCGDGMCSANSRRNADGSFRPPLDWFETPANCAPDCPPTSATCGNGYCDPEEDCATCPCDCPCVGGTGCFAQPEGKGQCTQQDPGCGDGTCAPGVEDCGNCPVDCGCGPDEACLRNACAPASLACPGGGGGSGGGGGGTGPCGNGRCEAANNESCRTCAADCGACPPPIEEAPTLHTPTVCTATLTPRFEWTKVPHAATYWLVVVRLRDDQTLYSKHLDAATSCTTVCRHSPLTLEDGESYRWKVKGVDAAGLTNGFWSDAYGQPGIFRAQTEACPVPTVPPPVHSPVACAASLRPTFLWDRVPNDFWGYRLIVNRVDAAGEPIVYDVDVPAPATGTTASWTVPPQSPALLDGAKYRWKVKALDGNLGAPYSQILYFDAHAAGFRCPLCGDGFVDAPEQCDPAIAGSACCDSTLCTLLPAGSVCRQPGGGCDVAERCSGLTATCPADALVPAGTVCRAAQGPCDAEETCSGTSQQCGDDLVREAGTECVAGPCAFPTSCDGKAIACPTSNGFRSGRTQCRAGTACAQAAWCDGSAAECPASLALANGTTCSCETVPGGTSCGRCLEATCTDSLFGTGDDGDLTVISRSYTDETRARLLTSAAPGTTTLAVSSTTGMSPGSEVLVLQMTGWGIGTYETRSVSSVDADGGRLTLTAPLDNSYTVDPGSTVQVLRVPHYRNVTVRNGGALTVHPWDWESSTGGVMFFRATGTVDIQGGSATITVAAKGFPGGAGGTGGAGGWGGAGGLAGVSRNHDCPPTGPEATSGGPGGAGATTGAVASATPGAAGVGTGWFGCGGAAGGNGGDGGGPGASGASGGNGWGPAGGLGGGGAAGANTSPASLSRLILGSGGGGGAGAAGGTGGGGGGGGGGYEGNYGDRAIAGAPGGFGGSGGQGGVGGAGGGILFIRARAIRKNGTISANGWFGSTGGPGVEGGAGGAGGMGGGNTPGGAGGGGGGGKGAKGGGGGHGGGGGAGGVIVLATPDLTGPGVVVADGRTGGAGGPGGGSGAGGAGGAGGHHKQQGGGSYAGSGMAGASGTSGPSGSASAAAAGAGRILTTCGNGILDAGEACDGGHCCSETCHLKASGAVCRPAMGPCDQPDRCNGISSVCTAPDAKLPAGTVCRLRDPACGAGDLCNGTSNDCPLSLSCP